jgi:nucleotide-binding universal stress UspA family protein
MKTILAPVDFSRATAGVIQVAEELARLIGGRVLLFHAVQPPLVTSDYGLPFEDVQELAAVSERASARQLEHLATELRSKGTAVLTRQEHGAAVRAIREVATQVAPAYIVLGSHGHGAVYELLVGSTAQGVLKDSLCPVVVVPRKR